MKSIKNKRDSNGVFALIICVISPLLSLPFFLDLIALKKKYAFFFLALIVGLITSMYHPDSSKDLYRYYEGYEIISKIDSFDSFVSNYLSYRTDYYLYVFTYVLTRLGIGFKFYVLFNATLNYYLFISVFYDLIKKYSITKPLLLFLLLFFTIMIGLSGIISVSRNFTAFAIVIYSYYFGIWKNNKKNDYLILLVPFIHFSTLIFVLIYFISKYIKPSLKLLRIVLYFSFLTYLIPAKESANIVKSFQQENSFESTYDNKLTSYTQKGNLDRIDKIAESNVYGKISKLISRTIPFILLIFISYTLRQELDVFYYITFILVNVTSPYLSMTYRFYILLNIIFSLFYIRYVLKGKRMGYKQVLYITFMIIQSVFLFVVSYRTDLLMIFSDSSVLSLIGMLIKENNFYSFPM